MINAIEAAARSMDPMAFDDVHSGAKIALHPAAKRKRRAKARRDAALAFLVFEAARCGVIDTEEAA